MQKHTVDFNEQRELLSCCRSECFYCIINLPGLYSSSRYLPCYVTNVIRNTSANASMGMWRDSLRGIPPIRFFVVKSEGLNHAEEAPTRFMVASGGVLSEGYGHGGPGVCLGDDQTEAEGVPSQG